MNVVADQKISCSEGQLLETTQQMLKGKTGKTNGLVLIRPGRRECDEVTCHEMTGDELLGFYQWVRSVSSKTSQYYLVRSYYRDNLKFRLRWNGTVHSSELSSVLIKQQKFVFPGGSRDWEFKVQSIQREKLTPLSFDPIQKIDGQETHIVLRCISNDKSWIAEFWIRVVPRNPEHSSMSDLETFESQPDLQKAFLSSWKTSPVMFKLYVTNMTSALHCLPGGVKI